MFPEETIGAVRHEPHPQMQEKDCQNNVSRYSGKRRKLSVKILKKRLEGWKNLKVCLFCKHVKFY